MESQPYVHLLLDTWSPSLSLWYTLFPAPSLLAANSPLLFRAPLLSYGGLSWDLTLLQDSRPYPFADSLPVSSSNLDFPPVDQVHLHLSLTLSTAQTEC